MIRISLAVCLLAGAGLFCVQNAHAFPLPHSAPKHSVNPGDTGSFTGPTQGDPGWMRKMARRRLAVMDAAREGTTLAGLAPDKFNLPVILVQFSDQAGTYSTSEMQSRLFDQNESISMSSYYKEVSRGQFVLSGNVFGWYSAESPVSTYVGDESDTRSESADELVAEVLTLADTDIDFSHFDNDGPDGEPNSGDDDGYVDAVLIVYAGNVQNGDLWPHATWYFDGDSIATDDYVAGGDKAKIRTYAIINETTSYGDSTAMDGLGTACHEFGHVLGLPDLYDYSGQTMGIGRWGLMSSGASFPPHLSAWCKLQLGWVNPVFVTEEQTVLIEPVRSGNVFLIWEDGYELNRYFLLEFRLKYYFDEFLPEEGLLIYHVDETKAFGGEWAVASGFNHGADHKLVDLEEADGRRDLDYRRNWGDSGDVFPGSTNKTFFTTNSNPGSRDINGEPTGVTITNIRRSGMYRIFAEITPRTMLGYSISYDGAGISGFTLRPGGRGEPTWGGVLFETEKAGMLTGIDIGFRDSVTSFSLDIFDKLDDSSPVKLLASVNGGQAGPGWQTVELDSADIRLGAGEDFFAVIRADTLLSIDRLSPPTGRSYYSADGSSFTRLSDDQDGNLNIRARIRTEGIVACDFNADSRIDATDIVALLRRLSTSPQHSTTDYNRDGSSGLLDAVEMLLAIRRGDCVF